MKQELDKLKEAEDGGGVPPTLNTTVTNPELFRNPSPIIFDMTDSVLESTTPKRAVVELDDVMRQVDKLNQTIISLKGQLSLKDDRIRQLEGQVSLDDDLETLEKPNEPFIELQKCYKGIEEKNTSLLEEVLFATHKIITKKDSGFKEAGDHSAIRGCFSCFSIIVARD